MEYKKISDLCNIKTGKYDANHAVENGEYYFYTCALEPSRANTYSFEGELVMLPGNGANLGEVMYFDGKIEAYQRTYVLHDIKCNSKYIFYYLKYMWKKYIFKRQVGSATNYMKLNDIALLEIPIPSTEEQERIVSILEKAEKAIQKREESNRLLDEYLKSVFIDMFGDPITNPKGWDKGTIRDLIIEAKYGSSKKADEINGEFAMLRMNNLNYQGGWDFSSLKYIDLDEKDKDKYLVYKGDMLFNRTNSKDLVGKTAVYREETPMAYAGYLVRVRANQNANTEFISAYLNSYYCKELLKNMCKNIVGMANINAQEMQDIKIYMPPIELQNKFAQIVYSVESMKKNQKNANEELINLFNSLMKKAFNGEL